MHGFHPSKQIEKGGFGEVYRGFFRSTSIAIKLLTDVCILVNLLTSLHDAYYFYYLFQEGVFSVAHVHLLLQMSVQVHPVVVHS